jgi:ketosteroid isomerase-like protein
MKTPDSQLRQQVIAGKHKKYDEAFNKNDAAAVVALFTEDAVFVTPTGPIYGREAIEKWYADLFQKWHPSGHIGMPDQYSPHAIGAADNEVWSNGDFSMTLQAETGEPIPLKGYWSEILVRDGDAWKVQMLAYNTTPEPAPPA